MDELAPLLGLTHREVPTQDEANLVVAAVHSSAYSCGSALGFYPDGVLACTDLLPPNAYQFTAHSEIYWTGTSTDYGGVVLHEMVHALAGMNHVERDSVISTYGRYMTDIDRGLLRMVGDGLIHQQGMTKSDVRPRYED